MKVLFITGAKTIGGAERWIRDAALACKENEIEHLILCGGKELCEYYKSYNLNAEVIDIGWQIGIHKELGFLNLPLIYYQLFVSPKKRKLRQLVERLVESDGFNVVHVSFLREQAYLTGFSKKAKLITTVHTPFDKIPIFNYKIVRKFFKKFLKQCSLAICVCETSQKSLKQNFDFNKCVRIYNAVEIPDENRREELRKKARIKLAELGIGEKKIAGTIARLVPGKGIDDILMIAKELPEVDFVIVGGGRRLKRYKEKANERGLKNVFFLGFRKDAEEIIYGFDVFLLLSYFEGFPYVVLDAIAARLPVVVYDVGGLNEIREYYDGIKLFEPGNWRNAAVEIRRLLEEKRSYDISNFAKNFGLKNFSYLIGENLKRLMSE